MATLKRWSKPLEEKRSSAVYAINIISEEWMTNLWGTWSDEGCTLSKATICPPKSDLNLFTARIISVAGLCDIGKSQINVNLSWL
jgi:hypothetical protein